MQCCHIDICNEKLGCCLSPGGAALCYAVGRSRVNRHILNESSLKYPQSYANWFGRFKDVDSQMSHM